jgi:hypothetical protein
VTEKKLLHGSISYRKRKVTEKKLLHGSISYKKSKATEKNYYMVQYHTVKVR